MNYDQSLKVCSFFIIFSLFSCIYCLYDEQTVMKFSVGQNFLFDISNAMVFSPSAQKLAILTLNKDNKARTLQIFNSRGVSQQLNPSVEVNTRLVKYSYNAGPITYRFDKSKYNATVYLWTQACTVSLIWQNITYVTTQGARDKLIDMVQRKFSQNILAAYKDNQISEYDMYTKKLIKSYKFNKEQQGQIGEMIFMYGEDYKYLYVHYTYGGQQNMTAKLIAYDCETQNQVFSIDQLILPIGTKNNGQSFFGVNWARPNKYFDIIEYSVYNTSKILIKGDPFEDNLIGDVKSCVDNNILIFVYVKSKEVFQLLIYNISSSKYSDQIQRMEFNRSLFNQYPIYQCKNEKLALLDKEGNVWMYKWSENNDDNPQSISLLVWILMGSLLGGLMIIVIVGICLIKRYRLKKKRQHNSLLSQSQQNNNNIQSNKSSRISSIINRQQRKSYQREQKQKKEVIEENKQQLSDQMLARLLKKSFGNNQQYLKDEMYQQDKRIDIKQRGQFKKERQEKQDKNSKHFKMEKQNGKTFKDQNKYNISNGNQIVNSEIDQKQFINEQIKMQQQSMEYKDHKKQTAFKTSKHLEIIKSLNIHNNIGQNNDTLRKQEDLQVKLNSKFSQFL